VTKMNLSALGIFILFASSVHGLDYLYENIEAPQDDYEVEDDSLQETILTNFDYFDVPGDNKLTVDTVTGADGKIDDDELTLEQADFYLTNMLAAIDNNGLLDDLPEDNTNMKDPLQDLKSVVKDVEDEYDLVEEAVLMEQNDVEDPIIDDYEINYNQLSELKVKTYYGSSEELVALDSSLDYVEYPNNVVEVEEEQLLIQVREKGQENGSPKETKDFVYFENISTEMKAMEITLSLAIFMGSTVLLVGGVLATLHVWRAVRPEHLEVRNQGMKTVKLSGIVKSYAKLPADIRNLKNPSVAYQELYEPV